MMVIGKQIKWKGRVVISNPMKEYMKVNARRTNYGMELNMIKKGRK